MQTTIYYRAADQYLIDKLESLAASHRKSKSACILSILEEYFEAEKRIGEILIDLGVLEAKDLEQVLEEQKLGNRDDRKKVGELLVKGRYITESHLERALHIQRKHN